MISYDDRNAHGEDADGPYRYGNTRPFTVFALALTAAAMAVVVVGATWSGLVDATESERLSDPPDLKRVVETTGAKGREFVRDVRDDLQRGDAAASVAARSTDGEATVR